MKINSSYAVELKNVNKIFNQTVKTYQSAIKFCLSAFEDEWNNLKDIESSKYQAAAARNLIHSTSKNTAKYQEFDKLFYKLPSYLLTNVINTSIGILSSYHTQLDAYNQSDKKGTHQDYSLIITLFQPFTAITCPYTPWEQILYS